METLEMLVQINLLQSIASSFTHCLLLLVTRAVLQCMIELHFKILETISSKGIVAFIN